MINKICEDCNKRVIFSENHGKKMCKICFNASCEWDYLEELNFLDD